MKIFVAWQKNVLSPEALESRLYQGIWQLKYSIEEVGHFWKITFQVPSAAEALLCRDAVRTILDAGRQSNRISVVVSEFISDGEDENTVRQFNEFARMVDYLKAGIRKAAGDLKRTRQIVASQEVGAVRLYLEGLANTP